jgi:catechol 2,3-dioxygenase-like lactoylglutathione lyase family enzyme
VIALPTARMIVSVPTADLRRAFTFYRTGLGLPTSAPLEGEAMPDR